MTAKLLLHAGTHKTGTTTLQSVLAGNRAALAERGICYPDIRDFFPVNPAVQSANAHFAFANAVAAGDAETASRLDVFLAYLRAQAEQCSHIVLSAESIYRYRLRGAGAAAAGARNAEVRREHRREHRRYVRRLAALLEDFDVEVVLWFRRVERFAESLYSEAVVTTDTARDFPDFLTTGTHRFDYRFQIDLFGKFFPLRLSAFEEKVRGGLVESFFRDNGLGPAPAEPGPLRGSIPPAAVLWLCRVKSGQRLANRARRRRWLFALQPEAAGLFGGGAPASFWANCAARDAFIARYHSAVPEIAFPAPAAELPPPALWSDAEHRAAETAFARWERRNRDWIAGREAARTQPFMP